MFRWRHGHLRLIATKRHRYTRRCFIVFETVGPYSTYKRTHHSYTFLYWCSYCIIRHVSPWKLGRDPTHYSSFEIEFIDKISKHTTRYTKNWHILHCTRHDINQMSLESPNYVTVNLIKWFSSYFQFKKSPWTEKWALCRQGSIGQTFIKSSISQRGKRDKPPQFGLQEKL